MTAAALVKPTVHVLRYGRVLCGSVHGLPRDWGPGHRWVSVAEDDALDHATCATCREQLELLRRYELP